MSWLSGRGKPIFIAAVLAALAIGGLVQPAASAPPPSNASVAIQPGAATLAVGDTAQLQVVVRDKKGMIVRNPKVAWATSDAAVATVSRTGLVAGLSAGAVTITATSGSLSATATVTVASANTAPDTQILSPVTGAAFVASDVITFTASASDAEEGDLSASIAWTIFDAADPTPDPTSLGSGASIDVGPLDPGSYRVTAKTVDSGGLQSAHEIGITVAACTVTAVLTPKSGLFLPQTITLDASGSSDSCQRPLQYFWACTSGTSILCDTFLPAANADGNTHAVGGNLLLNELDSFDIDLDVCAAGTSDCAPQLHRQYTAIEV
jgi:hypothetical protein